MVTIGDVCMKANYKTNAMRILDSVKIIYKVHHYSDDDEFKDGVTIAGIMRQDVKSVFKTLVTVAPSKQYYVFVVPVAKELNLKAAAKAVREKSVEMIKVADITKVTGYVRGGCSPIGMKKEYKTVIDKSALAQETIFISAGKRGYQLEISLAELKKIVDYDICDLIL